MPFLDQSQTNCVIIILLVYTTHVDDIDVIMNTCPLFHSLVEH